MSVHVSIHVSVHVSVHVSIHVSVHAGAGTPETPPNSTHKLTFRKDPGDPGDAGPEGSLNISDVSASFERHP